MASPFMSCLQFLCFALAIVGTCAGGGTWEVIVQNAGIAAMHAAVMHTGNVMLLDRTNTGQSPLPLLNGQCRDNPADLAATHDCSAHSVVLDLAKKRVRPVKIQTDTWCSSGQFLPDGTLLQSGGWNDGNKKFRRFSPCKSSQFCDWFELPDTQLYDGRWYATNQILPDGSMIIVGGIGISTLEYYPPRGGSTYLGFLGDQANDEGDNLYPFVCLLPTGTLFIFANVKSIIYDYINNRIVTELPPLPGGPRNYPSAGSSAMLALTGDYSSATIVICGGAQYGAFKNQATTAPTQNTCGWIVATDGNPAWVIEYMPAGRIMGDMVMLPTGDVLMINGAKGGSQGFGLATDPYFEPVLYHHDPFRSTFTPQTPTDIPRLYHSTANLLPDCRVLVAGSNTHWGYTWSQPYPTELRIEAFSPDYLSPDKLNVRPVVVKAPKSVRKGNRRNYIVYVRSSNLAGTVEVNIASAPYSTHSYSQGQRLVKMNLVGAVVPLGGGLFRIVFKAPPNGNVTPPGYYMMFVVCNGVPSIARWVRVY